MEMESMRMVEIETQYPYNNQNIEGELYEHGENGDSVNGNSIPHRGKNRPCFAKNGAEKVIFNPMGQAVEPDETVARWGRYIGLEAVDPTLLPIDVKDWRKLEQSKIDKAWDRARKTIDWTQPETQMNVAQIRNVFEKKLNDRWKAYKYRLKKDWERKYMGTEDHYKCGDDRVSPLQWIGIVKHWETDEAKKRAATNKRNRDQRRMNQTTGTTTFAQIRHKYRKENGGAEPSRCKVFELTHMRKNGTMVDEASEKAIRDMETKINEEKEKKRELELPETLTEKEMNEVYAHVLGEDKRNMVRGFGAGVRQEDVFNIPFEKTRGVQVEVAAMRAAHELELENVRREATAREANIREEMSELKMMLLNQEAAISKLLGSSNHLPMNGNGCNTGQALSTSLFEDVYRVPNLSEEGLQGDQSE